MSELLSFVLSEGDNFRRQRLPSLYSDFAPQRNSNPDGFAANTSAWITILEKAAQAGLLPTDGSGRQTLLLNTGDALLRSLETKEWGRPLALGSAIDEAVSQRRLIPYTDFLAARKSIYNRRWTVQPWWLLSWGLRQLGFVETSTTAGTLPAGSFVILQNVEEAARRIIEQMGSKSNQIDRILPMLQFRKEAEKMVNANQRLTDIDLQILLTYLSRDKSTIIYDIQTVKLKSSDDLSSILSDEDRTISSLKSLMTDINEQMTQLSARIATLSENAQIAIRKKNRPSALAALRSKKLNETTLMQRSETLAQLEEVYSSIERAADQATIVRVLEGSTSVLRNLNAAVGGAEKVEGIVQDLRDEMSSVDEVSTALEAGAQGDFVVDETAVDEEFDNLERQAKMDDEKAEALETQKRLASIDDLDKTAEVEVQERGKSNQASDNPIEESTTALIRLSLDNEAALDAKNTEDSQESAKREPNSILGS